MSTKGISFRLNSQITTIAIIIIASIVYINYHFSNKVLVQKIEEGAINQSNLVIFSIARITVGTEEIARNVSNQALYYYKNNDLDFFIHQVLQSNSTIESIHVSLFNGQNSPVIKFSSGKCDQNDCISNQLQAEDSISSLFTSETRFTHGVWSKPYYCKSDTSSLFVSYQMPVYYPNSNELAGMATFEVSLKKIGKMLSEMTIGKKGYAFIVDQLGNYITHPQNNRVLKRNMYKESPIIFKKNSPDFETNLKEGRRGASLGISEDSNHEKSWYYYAPLPNSGWNVIIVIPEDELFSDINLIYHSIFLVSVFGILILFFLNFIVFRRMLDPLVRVTYAIQRFTSMPGKDKKSGNEIKMLAESLEDWQVKYGVLIKNQSKTASEKLKIEKDLKTAQEIQLNIVPSGNPDFADYPEIDLYAVLKPAEIIGGDLYDYFFIGKNHLLIAIGDVSGKGIPASLFMAIASTLIKTNAKILSSKDIVTRVNKELCERNSNQYFVTLFLGILDVRHGVLDYCNAAHNYPYILHADGTLKMLSKSHGLPLGIYNDKSYSSSTVELHTGDTMILYTDGVINSKDIHNHHYGTEKLEANIQNLNDLSAEEVVNRLWKSINIYEGENHQADDISLMALKYLRK